ncbi:membrane protein [Dyadobacter beijingensis]|uniref:Membrane protein n=1 Tax=Dyadobacter beijingensis TaxID=365489 RepID=A0ABQ2HWI9_9BACT|nr:PepSY-associated TM helix domain-containing protein [Dyadobacter beijingensis]GGM93785.1 membrane protein [Dyadobacter beijingensis]
MSQKKTALGRLIGTLHLWLGLASGLVIIVIGLTGAIYVFTDELKPLVYRDRFFVQPESTPKLPLSRLLALAQAAVGEKRPVTRVEISSRPDRTYIFRALKVDKEGFSHWDYYKYYMRAYVNPYNGKVVMLEDSRNEFFTVVLGLHMRMLFGEKIGHPLVSYSVLAFVMILIFGLVLWWPAKWKKGNIDKSFKIKWNAKFKRVNYDLHNVLGFYACVILFMCAVTGLVWAFEWFGKGVKTVADGGKPAEVPAVFSDTTQNKDAKAVDRVFAALQHDNPAAYGYLINFPAKGKLPLNTSTYLTATNRYDRIQGQYDQFTGGRLRSRSFGELTSGEQIYAMNFDLHVGAWAGLPSKILTFFAGLICASLPVTGVVIWWGRRKKGDKGGKGERGRKVRTADGYVPPRRAAPVMGSKSISTGA